MSQKEPKSLTLLKDRRDELKLQIADMVEKGRDFHKIHLSRRSLEVTEKLIKAVEKEFEKAQTIPKQKNVFGSYF
jgi:hypothetical protein